MSGYEHPAARELLHADQLRTFHTQEFRHVSRDSTRGRVLGLGALIFTGSRTASVGEPNPGLTSRDTCACDVPQDGCCASMTRDSAAAITASSDVVGWPLQAANVSPRTSRKRTRLSPAALRV